MQAGISTRLFPLFTLICIFIGAALIFLGIWGLTSNWKIALYIIAGILILSGSLLFFTMFPRPKESSPVLDSKSNVMFSVSNDFNDLYNSLILSEIIEMPRIPKEKREIFFNQQKSNLDAIRESLKNQSFKNPVEEDLIFRKLWAERLASEIKDLQIEYLNDSQNEEWNKDFIDKVQSIEDYLLNKMLEIRDNSDKILYGLI